MAPVIASTVVDRPAAEVFAYAIDPARFHEWQQGVIDGHLDPPGPAQVGTKCLTTRRIGGSEPNRHLRASPDRHRTQEMVMIPTTDPSAPPSTSPWNP